MLTQIFFGFHVGARMYIYTDPLYMKEGSFRSDLYAEV